jgi:hypothetical protein
MKRIFLIFMLLILSVTLVGCKNETIDEKKYADDRITISIKSIYKEEFLDKKFGFDDFNYKNVESFSYSYWYGDHGFIFIHLKKTGKREVKKAMRHFEKLYFVEFCSESGYGSVLV